MKRFSNHPVARNAIALYAVQFAGYGLPLITVPFLARVLGPEGWGLVVIAQSFGLWVSLLLEYGFNLSATREIARHRHEPERVAEIAAGVMGAKALLFLATSLVSVIVGRLVPAFTQHPDYMAWVLLYTVALGFSPFWYFQGTERMSRAVLVELCMRAVSTAGVLVLVKAPGDGWKVLAFNGIGGFITTVLTLVWVYTEVTWRWPTLKGSFLALRQGWSMFLFRGAVSLYTTANAFILGLFVSPTIVGYFGGADKICRAALGLLSPISQSIYPRMNALMSQSPKQAARLAQVNLIVIGLLGTSLGIFIILAAPWLVKLLLGAGYEAAIMPVRVLALLLPVTAVNNVLGMQWMLPLGLERYMSYAVVSAGVLDVVLATVWAPRFFASGMAWAVVSAEVCIVIMVMSVLYTRNLDPIRVGSR